MRLSYPSNVKIILVPCTGKVDVIHMLTAIQKGADGVYCVGCLEGACHYNQGNLRCRERVNHVRSLLQEIGLEPDRVRMYNLSSGEGADLRCLRHGDDRDTSRSSARTRSRRRLRANSADGIDEPF